MSLISRGLPTLPTPVIEPWINVKEKKKHKPSHWLTLDTLALCASPLPAMNPTIPRSPSLSISSFRIPSLCPSNIPLGRPNLGPSSVCVVSAIDLPILNRKPYFLPFHPDITSMSGIGKIDPCTPTNPPPPHPSLSLSLSLSLLLLLLLLLLPLSSHPGKSIGLVVGNLCLLGANRAQRRGHIERCPGAGIMEADDRQVTSVFTVQPSFHQRHSTNPVSWSVTIIGERAITPHLVVRRRW